MTSSSEKDRALDGVARIVLTALERRGSDRVVPQRTQLVYFIRREADGLVKIGKTTNVHQRLASIRVGAGPVTLLATIPGGNDVEREWHERFAHLREHGEWFRPDTDLLGALDAVVA